MCLRITSKYIVGDRLFSALQSLLWPKNITARYERMPVSSLPWRQKYGHLSKWQDRPTDRPTGIQRTQVDSYRYPAARVPSDSYTLFSVGTLLIVGRRSGKGSTAVSYIRGTFDNRTRCQTDRNRQFGVFRGGLGFIQRTTACYYYYYYYYYYHYYYCHHYYYYRQVRGKAQSKSGNTAFRPRGCCTSSKDYRVCLAPYTS